MSANAAALGRSPWSGDPWLNGAIDEVRIYAGQLLPDDIAATQLLGPNALLTTNVTLTVSHASSESLTLSWPVAASGFALESSTSLGGNASWAPVGSAAVVSGPNNQVTISPTNWTLFFRLHR